MTRDQEWDAQHSRVKGVILDWAGTTIDFGSRAPAQVFREIFVREGVNVTERHAREPMGRGKRDHIATVLQNPEVSALWTSVKGSPPCESDVDRLYEQFLPLQKEILSRYVDLIPGLLESMAWLRERRIRIGSTTGYTRSLMEVVTPIAFEAGYRPEAVVCSDEVPAGRPAPWMLQEAAKQLDVYPPHQLVAVDDTPVGIEAGKNAGYWTIAVIASGNELGLSREELDSLSAAERDHRLTPIREKFERLNADVIIDSVADLPSAIEEIETRLGQGQRP